METLDEPWPGETWPASTLRYTDAEGKVHIASPRDPLYSTVSLCATEYWDGESWQSVDEIDK